MIAERAAILKRRVRDWPTRYVVFVDIGRGLIHENGTVIRWDDVADAGPAPLDFLLELATDPTTWGVETPTTIYIVGGWDAASTPTAEWLAAPGGWERSPGFSRYPLVAQYRSQDGRRAILYATSQWFGSLASAGLCRKAYIRLRTLLRSVFDDKVVLMGTPARTGLDLIERSLPRTKDGTPYEYPVLEDQARDVIENEIGQGRMEFLPPVEGAELEGQADADTLFIEDAIWFYASCVRHLPAPPMQHDTINEFAGYRAGFYRVLFKVPEGWQHIGLLPVRMSDIRGLMFWNWPNEYHPRAEYMTVVGDAELRLALDNGWPCEIIERWLFADDRASNADPLRQWAEKLRMLRENCTDTRERELAKPLRDAIRSLLIKALGGMHRRGRTQVVETPLELAETIDPDAEIEEVTPTSILWRRPVPLDRNSAHLQQSHWPAIVWSRARAKLAAKALELPRAAIVALRSDAIVTTLDPGWRGEKPGEFRLKRELKLAGRPVPQDENTYRELLGEGREE